MNQELEQLMDFALADGVLTDKKKDILSKKAKELNVDPDEFEMVLQGKVFLKQKEMQQGQAQQPPAQPQVVQAPVAQAPPQPTAQATDTTGKINNILSNVSKVESEAAMGSSLLNGLKNMFGI